MKTLKSIFIITVLLLIISCNKKEEKGRFNYPMIKSKISLNEEQTEKFDKITTEHTALAKKAWMDNKDNNELITKAQKEVFDTQDEKIKAILSTAQYNTYLTEVTIERKGRERYTMEVIKNELGLDSIQSKQYNLTNEAFFTTLLDNHDNYHGKPDVFKQYHKEIDVSRRATFQKIMTPEQYTKYIQLIEKYEIGKSEH